jgi:purine-binding chemotaxis protein CheW
MTPSIDVLHVVFRVGAAEYVLPASIVLELESFTSATPVPGAPPHVAGLMQIRGQVIPVVDLRKRFGIAASEPLPDQRVIVVEQAGRRVGLLVDTAREVLKLAPDTFRPPPELVIEQAEGYVKAVAQHENRLVMLLDAGLLLNQEDGNGQQRQHQ